MKVTAITVTKAARNFFRYVHRVHKRKVSYVLLKHGAPVARLVPKYEKICTGRELAEALSKADLTASEARAWRNDIFAARAKLSPSKSKWE